MTLGDKGVQFVAFFFFLSDSGFRVLLFSQFQVLIRKLLKILMYLHWYTLNVLLDMR